MYIIYKIYLFIIYQHLDGADSWNSSFGETQTHVSDIDDCVSADALVPQGAESFAVIVLT